MEKKIEYEFIASSKVIRHKLDPQAADILAVLIYKQEYWKNENRLTSHKGKDYFYVSHSDVEEETSLGISVIKNRMSVLKKEGLISSKRQGLTKPNLYRVDLNNLKNYIASNKEAYEDWRLSIRQKNSTTSPVVVMKCQNQLSGKPPNDFQEVVQSTSTKNKSTKNKNTNNTTNRINAVELEIDLYNYIGELTEVVLDLQEAISCDLKLHSNLYDLLIKIMPVFKSFKESPGDSKLIDEIRTYTIDANDIAFKILSNAKAINEGLKPARFGNLFVGLEEKNANREQLIMT